MIDLHCHYMPGVDDGARTMSEAIALIEAAALNGITEAVLTPHVYPGVYGNSLTSLRPVFEALQRSVAERGIGLVLHLGCEMRLHPDSLDLVAAGEVPMIGTLEGMDVLLLELPDGAIPVGALEACRYLITQGVRPLIAHPERNKAVMRDSAVIRPFVDAGCLLQVTAASVIGRFGPHALRVSQELIESGLVDVIATDAHNLTARPPLLREARDVIAGLYNSGVAERLTLTTPRSIRKAPAEAAPLSVPSGR